jgi:steroid delta-isomerase-like uncharacterized protein
MTTDDHIYATNLFTLKDPSRIDDVVEMVRRGVESTSSKNPGYIADTVYRSVDGKSVLNFSTWSGGVEQMTANHAANQANVAYGRQMQAIGEFAETTGGAYTAAFQHGRSLGATEITGADVERWIEAWNSHDIDRIVDLFTDDVVMHQPQNPQPLDKAGLSGFFGMLFGSYSDIRFELQGHTIQGRDVASWERVKGTMTGPFRDPVAGRTIEPTGKSFDILGAMHMTYGEDHRIREVRIYWDRMQLMQQVGLLGT